MCVRLFVSCPDAAELRTGNLARLTDQTRTLEARLKAGIAAATAAPPPAGAHAHEYMHDAALPAKLGTAEQVILCFWVRITHCIS